MPRIAVWTLAVGLYITTAGMGQAQQAAEVKRQAQEMLTAFKQGNYARLIDFMPEKAIKELGGRQAAAQLAEQAMKSLKDNGATITAYEVGEPRPVMEEGANAFTIVPTRMELTLSGQRIAAKSYLLAISGDKGKTWKFLDGAGLDNVAARNKLLPKLPAKLKLPGKVEPEILPDKK